MTEAQGQGPKTWWAGESSPEDKRDAQMGGWLFGLGVLILLPLGIITAGITYIAFSSWRIRWTVLGQITALVGVILAVTGKLTDSTQAYIPALLDVVSAVADESTSLTSAIFAFILSTAPVALVIGGLAGTAYCAFRWHRRAQWEETVFRLTPYQWFRKRRHISDIRNDKNGPHDGSATLGVGPQGNRIMQTPQEASAHTLFVGASGTGKTTTALMQARDHIRVGNGYVFVDLKGSTDVPEALADFARRYNRNFQHFTFQDTKEQYVGPAENGPSYYDPLARGNASRRKDMLISGRTWSDDYYKIITSAYLQVAFDVMIGSPPTQPTDAFADIIHLLNPANLADRARNLPNDPYYDEVKEEVHKFTAKRLDRTEQSAIDGMLRELQTIRGSVAGRWLRMGENPEQNVDLYRVAERGDVVVFSLDALVYPETARLIANLIISDLKTVTGELQSRPTGNPLVVFIDEFSAMDSDGIIGLINKSRSAGMPISLATQALGDLRRVDPSFLEQLFGIINAFVIHRTNTLDDAETLAGVIGKEDKWEVRLGVEHTSGFFGSIGKGSATGKGTLDKVEDYVISPHIIQNLEAGEIIYLAKSPKARVTQVRVIAEDENLTSSGVGQAQRPLAAYPHARERAPFGDPTPYSDTPVSPQQTYQNHPPTTPHIGMPSPSRKPTETTPKEPQIQPSVPSKGVLNGRDLRAALGRENTKPTQPTTQPPAPQTKSPTMPQPGLPRKPNGMPPKPGSMPRPKSDGLPAKPTRPTGLPKPPRTNTPPKTEQKRNSRDDTW